jgi:hypothetical protein
MRGVTWARAANTPEMHAIASVANDQALAYCRAQFYSADTAELDDNPPHETRCDGCCRVLVDRRCIERGLTELMEGS